MMFFSEFEEQPRNGINYTMRLISKERDGEKISFGCGFRYKYTAQNTPIVQGNSSCTNPIFSFSN